MKTDTKGTLEAPKDIVPFCIDLARMLIVLCSIPFHNKQTPSPFRRSKTLAVQHLAESAIAAPSDEDSDDSILGEHSPFVKHTNSRQRWV